MKKLFVLLSVVILTTISASAQHVDSYNDMLAYADDNDSTGTYHYFPPFFTLSEAISDVEDYIEWMQWDIHEGVIDKHYGELYLENFNGLLIRLRTLNIEITDAYIANKLSKHE